jgi:hypothetical protein
MQNTIEKKLGKGSIDIGGDDVDGRFIFIRKQ